MPFAGVGDSAGMLWPRALASTQRNGSAGLMSIGHAVRQKEDSPHPICRRVPLDGLG